MIFTPRLSRIVTEVRKRKTFPFQGIVITFLTLILFGVILQVVG